MLKAAEYVIINHKLENIYFEYRPSIWERQLEWGMAEHFPGSIARCVGGEALDCGWVGRLDGERHAWLEGARAEAILRGGREVDNQRSSGRLYKSWCWLTDPEGGGPSCSAWQDLKAFRPGARMDRAGLRLGGQAQLGYSSARGRTIAIARWARQALTWVGRGLGVAFLCVHCFFPGLHCFACVLWAAPLGGALRLFATKRVLCLTACQALNDLPAPPKVYMGSALLRTRQTRTLPAEERLDPAGSA